MPSSTCHGVAIALATTFVTLSLVFSLAFFFLQSGRQKEGAEEGILGATAMAYPGTSRTSYTPITGPPKDDVAYELAPEGMRVKPVFELQGLDPEKAEFLEYRIIPKSISALTRTFKLIRPEQGPLLFERRCRRTLRWSNGLVECSQVFSEGDVKCGNDGELPSQYFDGAEVCSGRSPGDCEIIAPGSGAENTDFVLVVTANNNENCASHSHSHSGDEDSMSAQGGWCMTDKATGRPTAGFINFCPSSIQPGDERDLGKQVDLAVHEILHGLVFEPNLFENFRDASGQPYPYDVVEVTTNDMGQEKRQVVTPHVKAFVRDHFGCEALEGAELENQGGSGTQWSHWEESLFYDEIMTGLSSGSGRSVLSNLTLALMEDSGWYLPVEGAGGHLGFGKNAGCDMALRKCHGTTVDFRYYCDKDKVGENACMFNDLSLGVCQPNPLSDGCPIVKGYGNYLCQDRDMQTDRPLQIKDSSSLCVDGGADSTPWVAESRKREGLRVSTVTTTYPGAASGCFAFRCSEDGGQVFVNFGSKEVPIDPGAYIELADLGLGFTSGRFGPGPSTEVCQEQLSCSGRCNALNGYCREEKCHCHLGYYGHYCEEELL